MAQTEIRFGVRDEQGRRASTWTFAFKSRPEVEPYLFCRVLGRYIKTSFHRRKWRHAYIAEAFDPLFEGLEYAPEDRCIDEWDPPGEIGPGVTKALRILTPWSAPRVPIEPDGPKIEWIPGAPQPRWTEIAIFFLAAQHANIVMPAGSEPNGTIGTKPLGNGGAVHIIYLTVAPPALPDQQQGSVGLYAGKRPADLRHANAALAIATDSEGVRVLFDMPHRTEESAIERLDRKFGGRP